MLRTTKAKCKHLFGRTLEPDTTTVVTAHLSLRRPPYTMRRAVTPRTDISRTTYHTKLFIFKLTYPRKNCTCYFISTNFNVPLVFTQVSLFVKQKKYIGLLWTTLLISGY